jgi:hypothetical protein
MMSRHRKPLIGGFIALLLLVIFVLAVNAADPPATGTIQVDLRINEFMAENDSGLENPDQLGDFPDWIELYNRGTMTVSLDGFFLTDNANTPTQYAIPSGLTSPPGGFLIFYADDMPVLGPQHTNFRLSRGGEYIGVYGAQGGTLIDSYEFGEQTANFSMGRYPDGDESWTNAVCATPGAANMLCPPQGYLPLIFQ